MAQTRIASNPFALMMDPASVFAAIQRSERLSRLHSRICRPLDKITAVRDGDSDDADDAEVISAASGQLDE